MQRSFAGMPTNVVEKVRDIDRVVPVEGHIRVGGPRAMDVSFHFFFLFFCFNCGFCFCMK